MTRASWNAQRRRVRDSYPSRNERGLPDHPDGSGLTPCTRCGGNGQLDRRHWDPQLDESRLCTQCNGSGDMDDGWRDPLLRLRYARQGWMRRDQPGAYRYLRQLCAVPVWQLRLIESAVGCELAANRAVQAWREVA